MPQISLKEVAERAWELLWPLMEKAQATAVAKRADGCMRVSVRLRRDQEAIHLLTKQLGDPSTWELPYAEIADGKLTVSIKTGLPSRYVSEVTRILLGGSQYWGSWVSFIGQLDELRAVAAFSGVDPEIDELYSKFMLDIMNSLIELDVKRAMSAGDDSPVQYLEFVH